MKGGGKSLHRPTFESRLPFGDVRGYLRPAGQGKDAHQGSEAAQREKGEASG